ncbi:hypothetical protein Goklo_012544 [Gossypium klotzschianum]|uniref:Uncharacterized protein n=1 Tax=Gossypium klotzschianum TaxID=34286 RepID=A0A7J8VCJ1_9ROSI|nr:hypothetical protein [Gossypium klotzschianum]
MAAFNKSNMKLCLTFSSSVDFIGMEQTCVRELKRHHRWLILILLAR